MFGALDLLLVVERSDSFDPGADDAASTGTRTPRARPTFKADASAGDARADTVSASDGRSDAPPDAHPDAVSDAVSDAAIDAVIDVEPEAPIVCTLGTHRCTNGVLEACAAGGAWVAQETCVSDAFRADAAGWAMRPAHCVRSATCSASEPAFQTCAADRKGWTTTQTCATDALCSAAGCAAPACNVGQHTCSSATLRVCNAGRTAFQDAATCSSAGLLRRGERPMQRLHAQRHLLRGVTCCTTARATDRSTTSRLARARRSAIPLVRAIRGCVNIATAARHRSRLEDRAPGTRPT